MNGTQLECVSQYLGHTTLSENANILCGRPDSFYFLMCTSIVESTPIGVSITMLHAQEDILLCL